MRLLLLLILALPIALFAQIDASKVGNDGLRVQIYLDQKCFGPGFLDGKPGNFTLRAVYSYNRFRGRAPGAWDVLLKEAEEEVKELFAVATVPSLAKDFINPNLPTKYEDVGGVKLMAYRSYLEFMAERYHTSKDFLIEINGKSKAYGLIPGSTLKVPNIEPFQIEDLSVGRMHKEDEERSKNNIVIDTKNKQIFIYDPSQPTIAIPGVAMIVSDESQQPLGKMIAMFPTTTGGEQFIHHGVWKVLNCVEFPSWRYDKQFLETGKRSKDVIDVAHGPNSPVGILWCGLSKSGIGIHGTSSPRTIGRSQSAGCYRLSNWDAARFPQFVRPGATVIVR